MGGEQTGAMRREHTEDTKHNGAEKVVGNKKQIMCVPMLAIHEKSCSKKQRCDVLLILSCQRPRLKQT